MARLYRLIPSCIQSNANLRPKLLKKLLLAILTLGLWFRFGMILLLFILPGSASAEPSRIVSLYPGHTDNIVALGAGNRLVGVSRSDDAEFLKELKDLPRLPPKVGAEALLALAPDVVFLRSLNVQMNPNLIDVLERAGIEVQVIDPPSWEGFEEYLAQLSEILGVDSNSARRRLKDIRDSIAQRAVERSGVTPRVFLEATSRELHTCAPGSWAARLIELAGGENAASNAVPLRKGSPLAAWGIERTLEMAQQGLDVYLVQQGAMNVATLDDVRSRAWFTALKDVHVEAIPERCLSRPSLLGLEEGGKRLLAIFSD